MKNCLLFAIIFFALISCNKKDPGIYLSGKKDLKTGGILLLANDEYSDNYDTIEVKNGEFSIPVKIEYPGYKYLILGKTRKQLFFAPGYSLYVTITPTAVADSSEFRITGEGATENYLLDSVNIAVNNMDRSFFRKEPKDALKDIDSGYMGVNTYFDKLTSRFDPDSTFVNYEKASLKYIAAGTKAFIGNRQHIKDPEYYSFVRNLDLNNEKYWQIPEYRGFFDSYLNAQTQMRVPEEASDEEFLDTLLVCIQKLENKKIREYFMQNKIHMFLASDLVSDPEKYHQYFQKYNTNPAYEREMNSLLKQKLLLAHGKPAPFFSLPDSENKMVSLSDFRGKYVYLDFWATWCGPCMEEMPDYFKLQSDYKKKDVVFLSVSFDTDKNKWLAFLKDNSSSQNNLFEEREFHSAIAKSYGLEAIPVFMLIDKDGNMIQKNAPRPSSKEIRPLLDSLLSMP
jgi:thiol-disulfide isomerase/thioredoxin